MSEAQPEVDFLILADRAEAINGKLYLMGGGWDIVSPPSETEPATFGVALGLLVPWLATNIDHQCAVALENADGARMFEMNVGFRTGRPSSLEPGVVQRVIVAVPVNIVFPTSGTYVMVASIGTTEKRVRFQAKIQRKQ